VKTRTKRLLIGAVALVGVLSITAGSCTGDGSKKSNVNAAGQSQTQTVVGRLQAKIPAYEPNDSAERRNNNERLKRWENPNKVGYLTVMAMDGTLIYYGTVKGKVSSLNSHNTNDEDRECSGTDGTGCTTRKSPDLDGSWGDNPQGIFWIDSANGYHEFMGPAIIHLSDVPTKLTQSPKLELQAVAPTPNR